MSKHISVPNEIFDSFISEVSSVKAGLINTAQPHYDDKALTLFLLSRYLSNSDFALYTNEAQLCELMGISNRKENKESIMSNLRRMEEDGILIISQNPECKFFWIYLQYEIIMPEDNYIIIYKKEFEELLTRSDRDKMLAVLCCIKKYQHVKTKISFVSVDTIVRETKISRPTVLKCVQNLKQILDIYQADIVSSNGTHKTVNYYKSFEDGKITQSQVESIAKMYYKNSTVTRKELL